MDMLKKTLSKRKNLILTFVLCVIVSIPVFYYRITQPVDSDFGQHVVFAQEFLDKGTFEPGVAGHPVLQLLLIFLTKISGGAIGLYAGMLLLQIFVSGLNGALVYLWIGDREGKSREIWRVIASVSVTLLAPFMILALKDGLFYFGYIGIANYHNPTVNLLKPAAILSVMLAEKALNHAANKKSLVFLSAAVIALSAGIKPNFVLVFLPALGIVFLYLLITKKEFDKWMLILGFALPGLIILALQYSGVYGAKSSEAGIILAPFVVESAFSKHLLLKFLLSSLFVIQGLIVFRKELISDRLLFLGWLMFAIGIFQNYFLAETGRKTMHGNFRWSGQIALFLLVIIILRKAFDTFFTKERDYLIQKISFATTYFLQFAGGIAYYIYCLSSMHYR